MSGTIRRALLMTAIWALALTAIACLAAWPFETFLAILAAVVCAFAIGLVTEMVAATLDYIRGGGEW